MSPASSVYCSLPSESVYLDSPVPSLGSVAKVKVLQSLQYLGRNHGLQLGHILFQQQLDVANYVAAVHHRLNWFKPLSLSLARSCRSAFSSGDDQYRRRNHQLGHVLKPELASCHGYAFANSQWNHCCIGYARNHSSEMLLLSKVREEGFRTLFQIILAFAANWFLTTTVTSQ